MHGARFTSQSEIDDCLGFLIEDLYPLGEISPNAKHFIRACLVYDSASRLTAHAALRHCWLREPETDEELFRKLEKESTSSWAPRAIAFPLIQDLSNT
jgi:serine/threonine protein kinase